MGVVGWVESEDADCLVNLGSFSAFRVDPMALEEGGEDRARGP